MKIKEFQITLYGPLQSTDRILLDNFNLLWGKNEEGKTLIIDALIKLLIGSDTKIFENIDRVEEEPFGYVVIEDHNSKEIKIPEKGYRRNLIHLTGLTPSEFRNIFIIRNSDLSIIRESEFYINVTDKLTGLKTEDISKIKNKLLEIGNLTPTGDFKDDIKSGKLKTRLNEAKRLKEKIIRLENEIKKEKLDKLEEELVKSKEEMENINKQIEILEKARKKEKFEIGKKALNDLKEALKKFEHLKIYNEKDWQLWRDCEKRIEECISQKEKILNELKEEKIRLRELEETLNEIERNFKILEEKKKKIDEEIRPELKIYQSKNEEIAQQKTKDKFFTYVGIITTFLLSLSLIGIFFVSSPLFYTLTILFLIITIISGFLKFQFIRNKAQLAQIFEKIKFLLSELKIEDINLFEEEYKKKYEELKQKQKEKEKVNEKINELTHKIILEIESKIKEAERFIEEIKKKSKKESLKEYEETLQLKQDLEKVIEKNQAILKSYFGEKNEKLEEKIAYWKKEIEKFEEYVDKALNVKYDETVEVNLKNRKEKLKEKIDNLTIKMKNLYEKMKEIEREANKVLQLDEFLYCNTLVELKEIEKKLQKFIEEIENKQIMILEVKKIFEEIEREEVKKVSELFGKESPVSHYFTEITDRRYEEVIFDQEERKIKVKLKNGKFLDPEKLSSGTYDQLYFSIRLALGEKLLKGKKGFFILDDPFIKYDPYRLKRQIEMLRKLSELGWQIIYFSAKGEIKDILDEEIKIGAIKYIELQQMLD